MDCLFVNTSLRGSRSKTSSNKLIEELSILTDKDSLLSYLNFQCHEHLKHFPNSKNDEDFYTQYKNYTKSRAVDGLSNSEAALAAAAWPLLRSKHNNIKFLSSDELINLLENDQSTLINYIQSAKSILLSTPVYFGDRSSLSQRFYDFIISNKSSFSLNSKFFAAVSVGAKRNGGQETTLVYSIMDYLQAGFQCVGNDSKTTSQYGGTVHAGDIGTAGTDQYGVNTCIGTGRRILELLSYGPLNTKDLPSGYKPKCLVINFSRNDISSVFKHPSFNSYRFEILNLSEKSQKPCLACDICPTSVNVDEKYRCIIKGSSKDFLEDFHHHLIDSDVILPFVEDSPGESHYGFQKFIERTRYLRRGDYIFSGVPVIPIVLNSTHDHYPTFHFRLSTAFLRHNTILISPIVSSSYESIGRSLVCRFNSYPINELVSARINHFSYGCYNPVGYYISSEKDKLDLLSGRRHKAIENRVQRLKAKF